MQALHAPAFLVDEHQRGGVVHRLAIIADEARGSDPRPAQLRLNRMKPQGRASRKKLRSDAVRRVASQPLMKALRPLPEVKGRGSASILAREAALHAGRLELLAKLVGLGLGLHRTDQQAVPHALLTQIDLADRRRVIAEHGLRIFLLHGGKRCHRRVLIVARTDLHKELACAASRGLRDLRAQPPASQPRACAGRAAGAGSASFGSAGAERDEAAVGSVVTMMPEETLSGTVGLAAATRWVLDSAGFGLPSGPKVTVRTVRGLSGDPDPLAAAGGSSFWAFSAFSIRSSSVPPVVTMPGVAAADAC